MSTESDWDRLTRSTPVPKFAMHLLRWMLDNREWGGEIAREFLRITGDPVNDGIAATYARFADANRDAIATQIKWLVTAADAATELSEPIPKPENDDRDDEKERMMRFFWAGL